jgi:molybdate transport system substrate-binding protein
MSAGESSANHCPVGIRTRVPRRTPNALARTHLQARRMEGIGVLSEIDHKDLVRRLLLLRQEFDTEFVIIKRNSWSKDAEAIVREMLGRTLRGVLVVAARVAAVPSLQVKDSIPTSACKPKRRSDVSLSRTSLLLLLAIAGTAAAYSQAVPPSSKGANNPAAQRGYEFHVADVDNVPDIHGNPAGARLVIFVGGNQSFVLPKLITAFEQKHPELQGHIFYETLPPGILAKQIAADGAITLGNLTIQVKPDLYESGARVLRDMEQHGQVEGVVANQIGDSLRKAGGESLYEADRRLDAGVTWTSEVRFQPSINNPIEGVLIPANQNTRAIYAGGVLRNAPHPELEAQWL